MGMFNTNELIKRIIKYLVEGLMIAIAAYAIPKRSLNMEEIGLLALNYGRQESELDYKNEKEILVAFKNKGISNCQYEKIENGQSSANIEVDKPYEYWKLFLVLGLFFITIEIALLRFMK